MDALATSAEPRCVAIDSEPEQQQTYRMHGRGASRSMEDLLSIQTSTTTLSVARHRHCSVPDTLDTVGKNPDEDDVNQCELDEQGLLSAAVGLSPSRSHLQERRKHQNLIPTLPLRAPRKEIHYDYVRRSIIHQFLRIHSLKRQATLKDSGRDKCGKATSSTGGAGLDSDESDEGYVIEYQSEGECQLHTQLQAEEPENGTSSSPYVQLLSSPAREREQASAKTVDTGWQNSDEAEFSESPPCSTKPPLFLHEHPSLTGEAVDGDDKSANEGDRKTIVIYEEVSAPAQVEGEHIYDSIQQIRGRVTQMVQGKYQRNLKKCISHKSVNCDSINSQDQDSAVSLKPSPAAIEETDSDSSGEDDLDFVTTGRAQRVKSEQQGKAITDFSNQAALRRVHTYHDRHESRRHEASSMRESEKGEILRKSQYDQMMEMMLSDSEVKKLQDAGAVKIKNITELRAEIEQLFRKSPSTPPPLPDQNRPKRSEKSKKKWSSLKSSKF